MYPHLIFDTLLFRQREPRLRPSQTAFIPFRVAEIIQRQVDVTGEVNYGLSVTYGRISASG